MLSAINDKMLWNKVLNSSEICNSIGSVYVPLPWCLGMHEAKQLCNKYRGHMTIVTSTEMQTRLFAMMEGISETVDCIVDWGLWTGFSDEQAEGHFVDAESGKAVTDIISPVPYRLSQPNGERSENCLGTSKSQPEKLSWFDTDCHRKDFPTICSIDNSPRIQIRGDLNKIVTFMTCYKPFKTIYRPEFRSTI